MIQIYHNRRCSKSKEGLCVLEVMNEPFEIIDYINNPLNERQIKDLLIKLMISPIELVRKNEKIWLAQFEGRSLSEDEIIAAMAAFPVLIQRPIVVSGDKAVIGRPVENISTII